ncbi:MAG: VanW family protein [Pseudobutyrivibrio sp.]|nr:VanW family protein [Pseudobutyrivibrio sp.]
MYKKFLTLIIIASTCFSAPIPVFAAEEEVSEDLVSEEATEENEEAEETSAQDTRLISGNISIAGTNVSGMTVSEAMGVVADYLAGYDNATFTLSANGKSVTAKGSDLALKAKNDDVAVKAATYGSYGNLVERFKARADLEAGKAKNFDISVSADAALVQLYLDTVAANELNDDVRDDYLTRENGEFVFHEGSSGVAVASSASADLIVDFIENQWDGSDATIELVTEVRDPKGSREELSAITDLLGSYSTDYSSSSSNRKANVANGVSFINGTVLYPGDEFSVINTITPFTAENGYQLAGSYANGTTVETFGGGICQVSTTLYGAVREAELEIVTRSAHSMIVSYVKPSMDAAISESGSKDFQIKNNKNYPVYIEGYCDNGHVYFNIYGKEEDPETHSVDYEPEITSVTVQNTTWVADPNVPLGVMTTTVSGHTGYTARLWKVVYENGQEVSRNVYNNSKYSPSNRTVTVGIASADPNLSYAMLQAVASQDAATIANAIAVYAPGLTNSTPFVITPKYQVTNQPEAEAAPDPTADPAPVEQAPAEVPAQ